MQFTFTQDDLELIATLEHDYDPETFWASSPARRHFSEAEWKIICERDRAYLARVIRWAIVFRDLPGFDVRIVGAGRHNPNAFKVALWEIICEGDLATEEWEHGLLKQVRARVATLGPEAERDYDELAEAPPAGFAVDVIFMDRDIEEALDRG